MGVDLDLIKQRVQEEEAKALARSAGGFRYWNPKAGTNRIRLMPPWAAEVKTFMREIYVHFKVGIDPDNTKTWSCLSKNNKGSCPICIFVAKLRATENPADLELAENIKAKQRCYSNIIDLEDPYYKDTDVAEWKAQQQDKTSVCPFAPGDTKIQVLSYGPQILGDLLNIFMDAAVDVTDLNAGHDIIIKKTGEGRRTNYSARADFKPSPCLIKGRPFSEAVYDLEKLMPYATEAQMAESLLGLGGAASLPAGTGGGSPGLPPASAPPQAPKAALAPPAAAPAPAPAAAPAPVAPAPAPAPVAPTFLPVVRPADAPPCFADWSKTLPEAQQTKTCDPADPECIGGRKGNDIYDPCPFYADCLPFRQEAEKPKTPSRRTAAKRAAPVIPDVQPSAVDDLEDQMRSALK